MSVKIAFRIQKNGSSPVLNKGLFLPKKNAPHLILIHGLTGTPNEMRFIANFFSRQGYSVSCPRLANHGAPLDILKKTKWQAFYESVKSDFLKVKEQNPNQPCFVGGLSMGALLALLLADEFPKEISAVSCLSPTLFYDGWNVPWSNRLIPLVANTPLRNIFYFKEEAPYGIKDLRIRQKIQKFYEKADLHHLEAVDRYGYPYFPVALLCELKRCVKVLNKKLNQIQTPVQLIQAKEDDMTSIRNSQYLYDRVGSSLKEIVLIENAYHLITVGPERETVVQKMESFFKRALLSKSISNGKTI